MGIVFWVDSGLLDKIKTFGGSFPFLISTDYCEGAVGLIGIEDNREFLLGAEHRFSDNYKDRAAEVFSSGRRCIRALQEYLSLEEFEVLPGEYGPVWPNHLVGSISHTRKLVAATILNKAEGVGIDIEHQDRLKGKTVSRVATEEEQMRFSRLPGFDWTLIFSAKESIFKAINPLARRYIGFQEVELSLDLASQSFSVKYSGDKIEKGLFDRSKGHWRKFADHLITMVTVI